MWVAIELGIIHREATCGVLVEADVGLALAVVRGSRHLVFRSVTGQGNCILRTVIGPEAGRLRQPRRHRHGDDEPTPVVVRFKYDGGEDVATPVPLASFLIEAHLHAYGLPPNTGRWTIGGTR